MQDFSPGKMDGHTLYFFYYSGSWSSFKNLHANKARAYSTMLNKFNRSFELTSKFRLQPFSRPSIPVLFCRNSQTTGLGTVLYLPTFMYMIKSDSQGTLTWGTHYVHCSKKRHGYYRKYSHYCVTHTLLGN